MNLSERIKAELIALLYTVVPAKGNDNFKKIFAISLLAVWIALTVAASFDKADLARIQYPYTLLTAAVFLLFGRLWGIEFDRRLFEEEARKQK